MRIAGFHFGSRLRLKPFGYEALWARCSYFCPAMASSEQKLISCVGFARRMAKRMPLVEVGSHLDHALVLLAGVESRARPVVRQPHPIQLTQMIPGSATLQTSEQQLAQLTCSNLLLHGQRFEGLQTRLEHRKSARSCLKSRRPTQRNTQSRATTSSG